MPKTNRPLSEAKISKAKPKAKAYKLYDTDGLYLIVSKNGGKWWRFKYYFDGKEKLISFGTYPETSLSAARKKRDEAREQIARGINPGAVRKAMKHSTTQDGNNFEAIAREWYAKFQIQWTPGHARTIISRMERYLFPTIGKQRVADITGKELYEALQGIENRGALETAHRVRTIAGQVFRFAVVTGRAKHDVSADIRGALPSPKVKHMAAIIDLKKIGPFLNAIDGYDGHIIVKCALRLAPLVYVRPGELRHAEWVEMDFDDALWTIPAHKMKKRKNPQDHIVPLSQQSIEILNKIKKVTGNGRYVFPSFRSDVRPMSENAILAAIRNMGFDKETMTGHGFRAMARTILDETLEFRTDIIEHQLAHIVKDPNGEAYNRTKFLDQRRVMMQKWADYLDHLKSSII